MAAFIQVVVDQHAEEAAFLWLLRSAAINAPHYNLQDLADLDERVEAHIDGLRIAEQAGWEACVDNLKHEEPGELFAAGVLALESGLPERLQTVYETAAAAPDAVDGLLSAFGWVAANALRGTVRELLRSDSPFHRRLGITACALHRVDPSKALSDAIIDDDVLLSARALKAAGECGRINLTEIIKERLLSQDIACRFWAAWSGLLLGERSRCMEALSETALSPGEFSSPAMALLLRAMTPEASRKWLKALHETDRLREVIIGAGIVGDPSYVPWLFKQMDTPELARVAGEAFSMITGVDIAYEDLDGEWPDGFEAGPTENPEDEDVSMDADEDLPWPDPQLLSKWWSANSARFVAGGRYLVGQPIAAEHCQQVLLTGFQRQRNAAALELALMEPTAALFETRAPGARQQRALSAGQ